MKKICFILLVIISSVSNNTLLGQGIKKPFPGPQKQDIAPPSWAVIYIGSSAKGVSLYLLTEYNQIISRYCTGQGNWWVGLENKITIEDRNRLQNIFGEMSPKQQEQQRVAFIKMSGPVKIIPSAPQINSWKDGARYGVWINDEKVKNSLLNNFQNTDFVHASVSKLYGLAKRNAKYSYQVNLMTKEYYQKQFANAESKMVFRFCNMKISNTELTAR